MPVPNAVYTPESLARQQAPLQEGISLRSAASKRQQSRFLRLWDAAVILSLSAEIPTYPVLSQIVRRANIPWPTVMRWMRDDSEFRGRMDTIEEKWVEQCKLTLYDATQTHKDAPWLALEVLKRKRRHEWGDGEVLDVNVRGIVAQVGIASDTLAAAARVLGISPILTGTKALPEAEPAQGEAEAGTE